VIGAGGIARRRTIPEGIVPARNACLSAVYSPEGTSDLAAQFSAMACQSESALLEADCDAVYIASPVHCHLQQVQRAAAAGKHVLCEKPLGRDVREAQAMAEACAKAGVKFGVGFLMRFQSQHIAAKELVNRGELGIPLSGRAQLCCWYPPIARAWRQDGSLSGGGSLIDMGGHLIDLLELFFGRTQAVFCRTSRRVHPYPVEDTAVALLEFAGGATGTIEAMFNIPDASSRNRLEIYGSGGSILAEGTISQDDRGKMELLRDAQGEYDPQQARETSGSIAIAPPPVNTYRAQIEAFSQAILEDTPPPVDGNAGVWNQQILAACYASAASGQRVELGSVL
jgi:predicted dehydrogenase